MILSSRHRASPAEVDRISRSIAGRLAAEGVSAGDIVAVAMANGPGFLAGLLAVRRSGAAALLFDAHTPSAAQRRTATDLGAAARLVCRRAWPRGLADFRLTRFSPTRARALPEDVAVIKLTSGSTGRPRGIVTPSAALVADDAALAAAMGLADDERILAAIPMSHSYGLSSVVMPALMRRGVLVLADGDGPLDPLVAAREQRITFLPTVPAYLQALLKRPRPPALPPSLRLVVAAGAPLLPATATRFRRIYGRPIHVFYGASECGGIAFDRDGTAGERGTLGTPVDGVEIALEPVPGSAPGGRDRAAGPRGLVTVTSAAVARSYLPRPHEGEPARAADTSLAGGRFRTRDLAVFRDRELVLEGRLDDLINVRGKKVDPREVETVLSRLEGVEDVVTLGVVPPGRDEKIVRSFVACRPGSLSYETVRRWCRDHLAEHKVPRSIVLLDELPRTSRGKPDRAALLELRP